MRFRLSRQQQARTRIDTAYLASSTRSGCTPELSHYMLLCDYRARRIFQTAPTPAPARTTTASCHSKAPAYLECGIWRSATIFMRSIGTGRVCQRKRSIRGRTRKALLPVYGAKRVLAVDRQSHALCRQQAAACDNHAAFGKHVKNDFTWTHGSHSKRDDHA
jgi:hypothetical protein